MKRGDDVYRLFPVGCQNGKWSFKVDGPFKIMGEIDGYLMLRRPRCSPFVLSKKDAVNEKGEKIL